MTHTPTSTAKTHEIAQPLFVSLLGCLLVGCIGDVDELVDVGDVACVDGVHESPK